VWKRPASLEGPFHHRSSLGCRKVILTRWQQLWELSGRENPRQESPGGSDRNRLSSSRSDLGTLVLRGPIHPS